MEQHHASSPLAVQPVGKLILKFAVPAIISNLIGVGLLLSMSYQTNLAEEKSGKVPFKRKKVVLKQIK